jgi:hemoglobin-like flavoprotein
MLFFPFDDFFFIDRLGPDVELLTEIMLDLGTKHIRYGVTADMFPFMGVSLIETLEEILGSTVMNEAAKEAWIETYADITEDMIKIIKK